MKRQFNAQVKALTLRVWHTKVPQRTIQGSVRSQLPLAEVEMESHGLLKSHSKFTAEPQYEVCGGGVISSNVAIEDNPAYQSVDVAAAKPEQCS